MASKKPVEPPAPPRDDSVDGPLMDGTAAAIKKMIARGRERGYVTYDEINAILPPEKVSSEQIEDTLAMLSEAGVNVVESEESDEAEKPAQQVRPAASDGSTEEEPEPSGGAAGNVDEESLGRTDDPVRMYLREMGSIELLSREGEIAIAKRIEAGRDKMIGGLCESPLTMRAIVQWRDALMEGKMLLRDIIDLEATMGGGPGAENVTGAPGANLDPADAQADSDEREPPEPQENGDGQSGEGGEGGEGDEASLSLSAMELQLKPQVL